VSSCLSARSINVPVIGLRLVCLDSLITGLPNGLSVSLVEAIPERDYLNIDYVNGCLQVRASELEMIIIKSMIARPVSVLLNGNMQSVAAGRIVVE